MRKNLLQPEVRQELVERIAKLTPDSPRQWGKMNVSQMLHHNAEGLQIAYGSKVTYKHPGWLMAKLIKFFMMKTDAPMPKEKAETFPEMNMAERGIQPDFNAAKKRLIEEVSQYPLKPTIPLHAFMGNFSPENWARLNYLHIDHHLKQFGV
jgi:hypothetical protein